MKMMKASVLVSIVLALASLNIVRAHIALSNYFCDRDVSLLSRSLNSRCTPCPNQIIKRVVTVDRRLTDFTYTFCANDGSFSFAVGLNRGDSGRFFTRDCFGIDNLLIALDPTNRLLAAEFFIDCFDGQIIKCPPFQVFDAELSQCVPRTTNLVSDLPCNTGCGSTRELFGMNELVCENRLFSTLRPTCETCATPIVQKVIPDGAGTFFDSYTYCASSGRFSLNTTGNGPKTFFTPYCSGTNLLVPLDATGTSVAARYYWDCHSGLFVCEGALVFDPESGACELSNVDLLATGLRSCPNTCSAAFFSSYGPSYGPAPNIQSSIAANLLMMTTGK